MSFDKRRFYQRKDVVDHYDQWRFGSPGGRFVDDLERGLMLELLRDLPADARILDLPCGTGRLLQSLRNSGFKNLLGGDTSQAMLEKSAVACPSAELRPMDAFHTELSEGACQAICSLRFLFHIEGLEELFREYHRILSPGGILVFDTIRWTPRGLVPPVDRALGGRLFCHGDAEVTRELEKSGFKVLKTQRALALPSLAYRFLPAAAVPLARWMERRGPKWAFTKTFVLARKERAS